MSPGRLLIVDTPADLSVMKCPPVTISLSRLQTANGFCWFFVLMELPFVGLISSVWKSGLKCRWVRFRKHEASWVRCLVLSIDCTCSHWPFTELMWCCQSTCACCVVRQISQQCRRRRFTLRVLLCSIRCLYIASIDM